MGSIAYSPPLWQEDQEGTKKSTRTSWVGTPSRIRIRRGPADQVFIRECLGRARILSQVIKFSKRFFGFRRNSCEPKRTQEARIRGAIASLRI